MTGANMSNADETRRTYEVAGMTCEHCTAAVRESVGEIPGVRDVTVDLARGLLTIDGEGVEDSAVSTAVQDAGYALIHSTATSA
jgi:copper chaperone